MQATRLIIGLALTLAMCACSSRASPCDGLEGTPAHQWSCRDVNNQGANMPWPTRTSTPPDGGSTLVPHVYLRDCIFSTARLLVRLEEAAATGTGIVVRLSICDVTAQRVSSDFAKLIAPAGSNVTIDFHNVHVQAISGQASVAYIDAPRGISHAAIKLNHVSVRQGQSTVDVAFVGCVRATNVTSRVAITAHDIVLDRMRSSVSLLGSGS